MKKIILLSLMATFISSCFGKFVTYDTSYKKKYSLKFENFYKANGETWTEGKSELSADRGGFNLDYGKTAGTITSVFKITYNGGNLLNTYPLDFQKVGISEHYNFEIDDCSSRALKDGETCKFKIIYKYSDNDDLENFDILDLLITDSDKSSSIDTNLFQISLTGHRKVKGTLAVTGLDNNEISFGTNDWNIEPASKDFTINYSGEFNIVAVIHELIGSDDLKPLFLVESANCIDAVSCSVKVRFPANTKAGNAIGNPVSLNLKVQMENADELIELDSISLEGRRLSETNIMLYELDGTTPVSLLELDDLNNISKTFLVKNIGETKTTGFSFGLDNSSSFSIDAVSTCQVGQVLNENETCNVKINFVNQIVGNYTGSIKVEAERLENRVLSLSGKVYEPATLTISPIGVLDFGSVVAAGVLTSESIVTLTKSSGEVPATVSNISISGNNFFIDNAWVNANKCSVGTILNNINDSCLVKLVFSPEEQANYPKDLTATLNFSYLNGKGITVEGTNVSLLGQALKDAELNLNITSLDFGSIIKDETKTLELNITNTGGIDVSATFSFINNEQNKFSILANECTGVIEPNETCKVTLKFNPSNVKGTFNSSLKVSYNNASGVLLTHIASLVAVSINPAILSVSPVSQNFGTHRFGFSAPIEKFYTVSNIGDAKALEVSNSISQNFDGSFEVLNTSTCIGELNSGTTCTVVVKFDPPIHISQVLNTNLNISYKDRPTATNMSTISAGIVAEAISYANLALTDGDGNFGDVLVNTNVIKTLTYTNSGYSKAVISQHLSSSDSVTVSFSGLTNPCELGTEIEVLETCSIKLVFSPIDQNNLAFNELFTLTYQTYDLSNSIETVLTGDVLVPAKLAFITAPLNFGNVPEGSLSVENIATLKMTEGTIGPIINGVAVSNNTQFQITENNCLSNPPTITGDTCNIKFKFTPALGDLGFFNSIVNVSYERGYGVSNDTASLSMNGTATDSSAVLISDPSELVFEELVRGVTGDEIITINISKQSGNHNGVIKTDILNNLISDFIIVPAGTTCSLNKIIGDACTISFKFSPNINTQNEGWIERSLNIKYYKRTGTTTEESISPIVLKGYVRKEANISFVTNNPLNFDKITQGTSASNTVSYKLDYGVNPFITNIKYKNMNIKCGGAVAQTFDPQDLAITCTPTNLSNTCNVAISLTAPADRCTGSYDNYSGQYCITYNNGRDNSVEKCLDLTALSLTPAIIKFNIAEAFSYNFDSDFKVSYSYNGQTYDIDGVVIDSAMDYSNYNRPTTPPQSPNPIITNIGESNAESISFVSDPVADNPFTLTSCTTLAPTVSCNVSKINFKPTNKNRGPNPFEEYISFRTKAYNGLPLALKNTQDPSLLLENYERKIYLQGTGLSQATYKFYRLDDELKTKFDDVYYYKGSEAEIPTNTNGASDSEYFVMEFNGGDVPLTIFPESVINSFYCPVSEKDIVYYENGSFPGSDVAPSGELMCDHDMPLFDDNGVPTKCLIKIKFAYSYKYFCGEQTTSMLPFRTNPLKSGYSAYPIIATSRQILSFEPTSGKASYCKIDFGKTISDSLVVYLKNYSSDVPMLIDWNSINSYYLPNQIRQNFQIELLDPSAEPEACIEGTLLEGSEKCKIRIKFDKLGTHAKYDWYYLNLPYQLTNSGSNTQTVVRGYADTVAMSMTKQNIKVSRYSSKPDSASPSYRKDSVYWCYNCNVSNDDNKIEVNFSTTNLTFSVINWSNNPELAPYSSFSYFMRFRTNGTYTTVNNLFSFQKNNNNIWSNFESLFTLQQGSYILNSINNNLNVKIKATNPTTLITSLGNITFQNNEADKFYGFTNTNNTTYAPLFDLNFYTVYKEDNYSGSYFVGGDFTATLNTKYIGNFNNITTPNNITYAVSRINLVQMCNSTNDKIFVTPLPGASPDFITPDFKTDCCTLENQGALLADGTPLTLHTGWNCQ